VQAAHHVGVCLDCGPRWHRARRAVRPAGGCCRPRLAHRCNAAAAGRQRHTHTHHCTSTPHTQQTHAPVRRDGEVPRSAQQADVFHQALHAACRRWGGAPACDRARLL
jgi:hypothetical protein